MKSPIDNINKILRESAAQKKSFGVFSNEDTAKQTLSKHLSGLQISTIPPDDVSPCVKVKQIHEISKVAALFNKCDSTLTWAPYHRGTLLNVVAELLKIANNSRDTRVAKHQVRRLLNALLTWDASVHRALPKGGWNSAEEDVAWRVDFKHSDANTSAGSMGTITLTAKVSSLGYIKGAEDPFGKSFEVVLNDLTPWTAATYYNFLLYSWFIPSIAAAGTADQKREATQVLLGAFKDPDSNKHIQTKWHVKLKHEQETNK